jgi:hypothetical protein
LSWNSLGIKQPGIRAFGIAALLSKGLGIERSWHHRIPKMKMPAQGAGILIGAMQKISCGR